MAQRRRRSPAATDWRPKHPTTEAGRSRLRALLAAVSNRRGVKNPNQTALWHPEDVNWKGRRGIGRAGTSPEKRATYPEAGRKLMNTAYRPCTTI
jgi:hypothetical protein